MNDLARIVPGVLGIVAVVILGTGCFSASSECRTHSDCADGERCVLLDGVFVSGGQCAPDGLLDASADTKDGPTDGGDAADATDGGGDADTPGPGDGGTDTSGDTGPVDAADTGRDGDTALDAGGDTCPDPSIDVGGADASSCRCHYGGESSGVCADQPVAPDGGCRTPEDYESDESTCDGFDNDCDGAADEGCPCDYDDRGAGICADRIRRSDGTCPEPDGFESVETSCSEGVDNDCDGNADCADDDCSGVQCGDPGTACRADDDACHEASCEDGVDNDGDGNTDCTDGDCTGLTCDGVGTECRNDDQQCHESDCGDGNDNDGDNVADCADTDCNGSLCDGPGTTCQSGDARCHEADCGDGNDNDGDGDEDCADNDCDNESCTRSTGNNGTCCPGRDACVANTNAC